MSQHHIQHQQVAEWAHQLWERAGQPDGRNLDFWLQAEAEAGARNQSKTSTSPAPVRRGARSKAAPPAR